MNSHNQDELITALYPFARRLIMERKSPREVTQALMDKGLTEEAADALTSRIRRERQEEYSAKASEENTEEAMRNMAIGGAVCLIGLFVTIVSYQNAAGGGRYVLAWGAILFGGFQFFKGLFQLMGWY